MPKKSVVEREKKRKRLETRYRKKRAELKQQMRVAFKAGDIPWDAQQKLQKLPRNSSRIRAQRRCYFCGRPHAVYKKFGLCRLCLRKFAMLGYIPGLEKASW